MPKFQPATQSQLKRHLAGKKCEPVAILHYSACISYWRPYRSLLQLQMPLQVSYYLESILFYFCGCNCIWHHCVIKFSSHVFHSENPAGADVHARWSTCWRCPPCSLDSLPRPNYWSRNKMAGGPVFQALFWHSIYKIRLLEALQWCRWREANLYRK